MADFQVTLNVRLDYANTDTAEEFIVNLIEDAREHHLHRTEAIALAKVRKTVFSKHEIAEGDYGKQ